MKIPILDDIRRAGFYSRRNNPEPARIQVPNGHVAHVYHADGKVDVYGNGEHYLPRDTRLHWMGEERDAPEILNREKLNDSQAPSAPKV